ncbi:MAG: amino acid adenylation domain-containing protein [Ardenticatenales bacterium]|nr:amino acid adenylation domain-containing protein [Ardenticatenales bacterium]
MRVISPAEWSLARDLARLNLPQKNRAGSSLAYEPSSIPFVFGEALSKAITDFCERVGCSPLAFWVAVMETLLYRYTAQESFSLGIGQTTHPYAYPAESLIIASCTVPDGIGFRQLLQGTMAAETEMNRGGVSIRAASPQEVLCVVATDEYDDPLAEERLITWPGEEEAPGLLALIHCSPKGVRGRYSFNAAWYEDSIIRNLVANCEVLVAGLIDAPEEAVDRIPLLTERERRQVLLEWNDTGKKTHDPSHSFSDLFQMQVAATPDSIAVVHHHQSYTYAQLNAAANKLAHTLRDLTSESEGVIGIMAQRGVELLSGILASLKLGKGYLPLDPNYPPARTAGILDQSHVKLVLADTASTPLLSDCLGLCASEPKPKILGIRAVLDSSAPPQTNLDLTTPWQSIAYIIYTSGSTGIPKGAILEQRGMINHLYAKIDTLALTASDQVAQTASQCFDISVWQFLAPLLVGGCVHIFGDETVFDPHALIAALEREQITVFETVPALLQEMVNDLEGGGQSHARFPAMRWIIPTGEALPPSLCERWYQLYPTIPLLNAYGPTECSDDVTQYVIPYQLPDSILHVPIGRPILNTRIYILDKHLQPVPIGVAGELYVGGTGVGRGYLNNPEQTAAVFLQDPFSQEEGARFYRTGDLARYLPDGNIVFLGRVDYQVKLRGFRIELGEIEVLLEKHPAIEKAIILVQKDLSGEDILVAFYKRASKASPLLSELSDYLAQTLPPYMIPTRWAEVEEFPLTSNRKLDRHKLQAMPLKEVAREGQLEEPKGSIEKELAVMWAKKFGRSDISRNDHFLDLGGHSLMAFQLVSQLREAFLIEITPYEFLTQGLTIASLGELVEAALLEEASHEDFEELLGELDALSEEEINALLKDTPFFEQEDSAQGVE